MAESCCTSRRRDVEVVSVSEEARRVIEVPGDEEGQSRRYVGVSTKAPFSCKNFWLLATVALSFLFGKNCPIIDYLG